MNSLLKLIILIVSLGGLLFGFDMAVVSGVIPLVKKYFDLSPLQEGLFVSSALIGCITGVILAGKWSDRWGRKSLLIIAGIFFLLSAIGCSVSGDFVFLLISRGSSGLGVGIASIVVPLYLAEISPAKLRGRTVTFYQLAVTFGILIAYLSNALVLKQNLLLYDGEYWRMMFLLGAIPALLFCLGLFFVPESPRWLLQKGRENEAQEVVDRLKLQEISAISVVEQQSSESLLKPLYRRALILGLLLPLFSQLSGINAIIYFGPTILLQSGLSLTGSLQAQIFFGVANVLFTCIAIWKVDTWGRRPLYLLGSAGAAISLFLTGWFLGSGVHENGWLSMLSILSFLLFFAFSIGPLKFVVASEIFPAAIRGRAMALSVMVMWIADALVGQLTPLMLASWGTTLTFWFFSGCCTLALICVWRMLPETKGKRLEEIETYWRERYKGKKQVPSN